MQPKKKKVELEEKQKEYELRIAGLDLGNHRFSMLCDKTFFELSELEPIQDGEVNVLIEMEKSEKMMDLKFHFTGKMTAPCDRCLDPVHLKVDFHEHLIINMVPTMEETSIDSDDNVWTINENDAEINLFHFIYESLMLSIPQQIVHPEKDGKPSCNPEMLRILEDLSNKKPEMDPRWEALKNIKLD